MNTETDQTDRLYGDYIDPESLELDEKQRAALRNGLIRKVYGILLVQLSLTTAISLAFTLNESWRFWILTNGSWLFWISIIAALSSLFALQCVPGLAQKHPANLWILFGFTLAEAIGVAGACASVAYRGDITAVLQALCVTSLITLALTCYAMQSSRDFTNMAGVLITFAMALFGFGLLRLLFPRSSLLETIYALLGAIMFSAYIILDTQRLIGKKLIRVSEDDYVTISLQLYADIIGLFVSLLDLLSQRDRN